MSEYLLQEYRPIVNSLLTKHRLSVPDETCDMLAKTIMYLHRVPRSERREPYSPVAALTKATKHVRALLRYAEKPSTHKDSVPKRCASLHAALLSSGMLVFELGVAQVERDEFEYAALLDSLEAGHPDVSSLAMLLDSLNSIQSNQGDWQKVGRPWGSAKRVVRDGCIAWWSAGRTDSFTWNDDREELLGPMPDFLRDLIACCNGTHELMVQYKRTHRPELPKGYEFKWPKSKGDSLRVTDKSLQMAIIDCKNEGLI